MESKPDSKLGLLRERAWSLLASRAARDGFLAAADQGVISLANFGAGLFLARNVSPTELGVYSVGFLLLHFIGAVQEGLILQPMSTLGAVKKLDAWRAYITGSAVVQAILSIVSALGAAVLGSFLLMMGKDVTGPTILSLWFVFLCWQPQEFIRRMFYPRGEIGHSVLNSIISNAARLAVLVWFGSQGALSGKAGLDAIAWGSLVAVLPGLWQARRHWQKGRIEPVAVARENWGFGRWILGGMLLTWVSQEVYPILAAGILNFAAAGAFRALQSVVAPVHVLLAAIDPFLTPRAARAQNRGGPRQLEHLVGIFFLIVLLPVALLLLLTAAFPEWLLRLFYEETYVGYADGLRWMCLYYGIWFLTFPLQSMLKAAKRTLPLFAANLAAVASMFTVGWWMILNWGVNGAIIGQALNVVIIAIVMGASWLGIRRERPDAAGGTG